MKAVVVRAPGVVEIVSDWPDPQAGPDDVIVEVVATGICGTDLSHYDGQRTLMPEGHVVGHEPIGVIVETGVNVDPARVGERVAVEPNYHCGECVPCRRAVTSLCVNRRSPSVNEQGFLVERIAVPASFAWTIPDSISERNAVCIEPLAVAMSAVIRAGEIESGAEIAIVGSGSIGRILADVLVRQGHVPAMIDLFSDRVELAKELGARAAGQDESFDLVFETSGSGKAASDAFERLNPMGRFVVVGVGNDPLVVDTKTVVRRGVMIVGSMIYDHPYDYAAVIDAVKNGRANPGVVLGEPYEFEDAGRALAEAGRDAQKTWIKVSGCENENN